MMKETKIFLVNPFISSRERYNKNIGDIGGHQLPLGIYYLAAYLNKNGYEVEVIDAEASQKSHEEVVLLLKQSCATVVGITSTTVAFRNGRHLAELVKKSLPKCTTIIGGPHVTAMPVKTMETRAFDYGIVQEGEIPFLKIVDYLIGKKGSLSEIPNLYRLNEEGQIVSNPERITISDLDTVPPPARNLVLDINLYKPPVGAFRRQPVANVVTSRGCPYSCIFCDKNVFGQTIRYFSAEYVAEEIELLVNHYGIREIAFLDDTFVINKKRLRKIFSILKDKGIQLPWTCMTRVNNLDFETLKFMRENGCWQIRIGIESGNQDVLDFIKKGITLEQVRFVAEACHRLKMRVSGFFIIGHHIDTLATINQSIEFALSIPLTDVVATINTPIPGTESYDLAREYGSYNEQDWTSLNYWTPVFVPHGLTHSLLLQKQSELYRRFYSRPHIIARQICKIRNLAGVRMLFKNAALGMKFLQKRGGV